MFRMQNNRFQSDKTQDFLNQANNDLNEFPQMFHKAFLTVEFYEIFSHCFCCFQKPITHVCSRHVHDVRKNFPIEDPNFLYAWLRFGHSRHIFIFLFTDIGSSWFYSFRLCFPQICKKYLFLKLAYMQMFHCLEFQRYRKTNIRATDDVIREFS